MFVTDLQISLCRTCLQSFKEAKVFNIFHTLDLAQKLILCSGLPVKASDEYPQNVCEQCYEQILLFSEFQQMCKDSLDKFKVLLTTKHGVEEVSQKYKVEVLDEAKDPLNEDREEVKLIEKNFEETLQDIDVLAESLDKKKRGRPRKKKMVIENTESKIITKISSRSLKQEEKNSITLIENNLGEYKEDSLFKNETEDILENMVTISKQERADDDKDIITNKKVSKAQEELEEKPPSDTDSCSSTQECFSAQRPKHHCDRCSDSFNALHRLEAHKREHDGLPPYSCTFEGCGRSFNRWHFFHKHQKEHKLEERQTFKCDVENCQRIYKNKSALNVHKRKLHNLGPELRTHMCEVCGKVFKSSAVLNDHHYTHIDRTQLPYACEEQGCSKRFSNKEKLKVHKMRHAGIKNFSCPYCGMRKTTRNELKIHINYHTLERTWPCRFCPKVCNSAGNLKMHVKNMHERAKDFACRFCDRTFAKADTKKYHEMTHTGEKPHECKECGRRFVQPAALRTHRKIHLRQKANLEAKEKCVQEIKGGKEVHNAAGQVVEESFITEAMVAEILSDTNGI